MPLSFDMSLLRDMRKLRRDRLAVLDDFRNWLLSAS